MPINNSYDIYNATLEQDKTIVELIIADIKEQLQINITNNINKFDYDTEPTIGNLPLTQQNRIIDRILYHLRSAGIRVKIKSMVIPSQENSAIPEEIQITNPSFPFIGSEQYILTITWYTRNNQEYMKTYC